LCQKGCNQNQDGPYSCKYCVRKIVIRTRTAPIAGSIVWKEQLAKRNKATWISPWESREGDFCWYRARISPTSPEILNRFWTLLKILNRFWKFWTDSEHYWKFWTISFFLNQYIWLEFRLGSRGRAISADIGQEFHPLRLVWWALINSKYIYDSLLICTFNTICII
jgi:hypothetical protein